jgi:hypothetical protein
MTTAAPAEKALDGPPVDAWLPVWLAWSMMWGDDDASQQLLSFGRRFEERYV